jgi:hypothetical protein
MSWGSWWKSLSPRGSAPSPRRLDGRSKMLLEHSIKMLPYDELGWKEVKSLFSPVGDQYALASPQPAPDDPLREIYFPLQAASPLPHTISASYSEFDLFGLGDSGLRDSGLCQCLHQ